MFDRHCSECDHQFMGPLVSTPCPLCGNLTFINRFKMQVSIPTEETKTKGSNEKEAEVYLDNEYKENRAEEIAISKTDEDFQRAFHAAEFPHRIARDLGDDDES